MKEEFKPRDRSIEPNQLRMDDSKKRKQSFGVKNETKSNQVVENKRPKQPQINLNPANKVIQGGTKTLHGDKK